MRIIPKTGIHLPNSQTCIPVQIFDLVIDHLSYPHTHPGVPYPTPPYDDLIHTFSFITSYPITAALISELQDLLNWKNNLTNPEAKMKAEQEVAVAELWGPFDGMHNQGITLQRQRVSAAQKLDRLLNQNTATLLGARLPRKAPSSPPLRELRNGRALRGAQRRASEVWEEVEEEKEDEEEAEEGAEEKVRIRDGEMRGGRYGEEKEEEEVRIRDGEMRGPTAKAVVGSAREQQA
jgi:hypothetical protein